MRYLITLILVLGIAALFAPPSSGDLDAWNNGQNANITISNITVKGSPTVQLGGTNALTFSSAGSPTFAGQQITASDPFKISQTWNNSGTIFTGLLLSITNTASSASSSLLDIQVGSSSVMSVSRSGGITSSSSILSGTSVQVANASFYGWNGTKAKIFSLADGELTFENNAQAAFTGLHLGPDSATATSAYVRGQSGTGTDKVGANLSLQGGISTGTASGGGVEITTSLTGETSASTANANSVRAWYKPKFVTLTDASATTIETFSLAANKVLGGELVVTTYATNSTPHLQCRTTVLAFQAVAIATTITATIDVVKAGTLAADSGTMTETFTIVDNGNNTFSIQDNADSDLTSPTDRCRVVVTALNGNAAITVTDP